MPPRLARLLAVLFAVALVVVAFVVRGALSDDETGSSDRPGTDGDTRGDGEYRLACDADLGDAVCEAAARLPDVVAVEMVTLEQVIAGATGESAPDWDLWLTVDPMPGVLDTALHQAGLAPTASGEVVALASGPLALLARELPSACGEAPTWSCLPEVGRPGVAIPSAQTSLGTVSIAAGAAGLRDGDTEFGISAYQGTDEADVLGRLVDGSPSAAGTTAARQADAMVRRGTASAAVTTEGLATRIRGTAQGSSLTVRPLTPEVTVGVVLVGLGTQGGVALAAAGDAVDGDGMRDALTQDGWAGDASASVGLPAADVVYALREELG